MDILQEIWSGLRHNKLRTILTGLSVSWGIFILIILLGAGNGLKNGVTSNFSNRATNTVQLWPGRMSKPHQGYQAGRNLSLTDKEVQKIDEDVSLMTDRTPIADNMLTITYKSEYGSYSVRGVTPHYMSIFNLKFDEKGGRFINQPDMNEQRKVIVLDQKIAELLFKNDQAVGQFVQVGQVMFQVIGVNTKKQEWGNGNAYIPLTTSQLIFNTNRKYRSIAMTINGLKTTAENDTFNMELKKSLAQTMVFDPDDTQALWIRNSQRDYIETMNIFNGITLFVSIIGIFTLIAGIVGVSNIMLVTVKERTREIGIRKALGAPPSHILFSVILESILITGFFGYIGMISGIGITEAVNYFLEVSAAQNPSETGMTVFKNPTVDLTYVYISTLILILAGIIAGYMPARKAVKVKPIEAMRDEN